MAGESDYAMRHRVRRAALLADVLRKKWDDMGFGHASPYAHDFDLAAAAAALSEQGWINAAEEAGINPPSDITRQICIGMLSHDIGILKGVLT